MLWQIVQFKFVAEPHSSQRCIGDNLW